MEYLILYIILIIGAALIENKRPRTAKTKMGWLKVSRCRNFGLTMRFEPVNRLYVKERY